MPEETTGLRDELNGQGALLSNLGAVRAVTGAIEGTLGPRGLDCLLLDESGGLIVTNDGVTILQHLQVEHPAGRLMIRAAEAQDRAAGDGTTTAIVLAGALIEEGAAQILRGVPVARVVEGIRAGVSGALAALRDLRRPVRGLDDPILTSVALVAGRGDEDLARAIVDAARFLGMDRLCKPGFELAGAVLGLEGCADAAFPGAVLEREPVAADMPDRLGNALVLVLEGALEPVLTGRDAWLSPAGAAHARAGYKEFRAALENLASAGATLVLASGGISEGAEQFLAEHRIMCLRRVAEKDLHRVASHTGARVLRGVTGCDAAAFGAALGRAGVVAYDRRRRLLEISQGGGLPEVTVLIGGHTTEVAAERERIARDAAWAVQHALRGGVVPGGGAAELGLARELACPGAAGMTVFGVACVREALKRPLAQMAANAGYNPLEKVEAAATEQEKRGRSGIGLDFDTGEVADLAEAGVWDPYPVKEHALRTAGEVAAAILRINNILKMRPGSAAETGWHDPA